MNEARAREILGTDVQGDNTLFCSGRYLAWPTYSSLATLDAEFDADELEAIAWWMKNMEVKKC